MLPPEITVTIEKVGSHSDGGDEYLAVARRSNDRDICRHSFRYQSDLLIHMEPQRVLENAVPRHAGESVKGDRDDVGRLTNAEENLADYGQLLYEYLFGEDDRFKDFLEANDTYRDQARLTLAIHSNAAALWQVPWEYLHDGKDHLVLTGRFLLSRVPHGLGQMPTSPAPLPLRLLVVISSPDKQTSLDTEEEVGVIQEALDEVVRSGRVLVEYLDDATLPAVGDTLRGFQPHVLHYTGHGGYDVESERSTLALEREDGSTHSVGITELRPYLKEAKDLRLVVLSGCHTARTSAVDAFRGVATGLLAEDIPAVLAMQASILDQSGIVLAQAFYQALAEGELPTQAVQRTRLALWQAEEGPGYDWGIPALYLRAQGMRLVDTESPAQTIERAAAVDVGGLPLPPYFVGRKAELRQLRRALREDHVNAVYVRGIGGMGKSSLAAKLLERPGTPLDGALVIRCHETDPLDIAAKLANFLAAQGEEGHAEAAALLLDSSQPPRERARQAANLIAHKRYLFVFDNFESVMDLSPAEDGDGGAATQDEAAFTVADPTLDELLQGLLQANWHSLCLFTGRYRWRALDEYLGRGTADEIHLLALSMRQTIMLMDNLPRLRTEPLKTKIALFNKVGGHPKSIELLNGWLTTGRVGDLLENDDLDKLLREEWEKYFLHDLLAQLQPGEQEALTRLSIFRTRLDDEEFNYAGVESATVRRWLDLSLLQREQVEDSVLYSVHPVVGEYLLGRLTDEALRALHTWAAAYHGKPFVEAARQAVAQSDEDWTDEQIEKLARSDSGVVGAWVRRADDLALARNAMSRALEWQHHLFQAGDNDAAGEIATAVFDILARWGERDRAKALLRGSIATREGFGKAVAQGNLANLLSEEGKLAEALATYEEINRTFEAHGTRQQMAPVLHQQSRVLQKMGRIEEAITKEQDSLQIEMADRNAEGQAISLDQLSILFMLQEDYASSLEHSRQAEVLARKLNNEHFIAAILHQQGLIFNRMAGATEDKEEGAAHRKVAFERFQESLSITRRIGDESGAASTLNELGRMWRDAGQMTEAIAAITEALDTFTRLGDPIKQGIALEFLGTVHEIQRQYAAALEKYRQALVLMQQYGSPRNVSIVENHITRVQTKMRGG